MSEGFSQDAAKGSVACTVIEGEGAFGEFPDIKAKFGGSVIACPGFGGIKETAADSVVAGVFADHQALQVGVGVGDCYRVIAIVAEVDFGKANQCAGKISYKDSRFGRDDYVVERIVESGGSPRFTGAE